MATKLIRHRARSLKQVPWKYKWGATLFCNWWIWYEEVEVTDT